MQCNIVNVYFIVCVVLLFTKHVYLIVYVGLCGNITSAGERTMLVLGLPFCGLGQPTRLHLKHLSAR